MWNTNENEEYKNDREEDKDMKVVNIQELLISFGFRMPARSYQRLQTISSSISLAGTSLLQSLVL